MSEGMSERERVNRGSDEERENDGVKEGGRE